MRFDINILALPTSILALVALQTISVRSEEEDQSPTQWPFNLPPHVKYWPEDPPNRRRDLEAIEEHLRLGRNPVGVMKMSTDEGEKFYMEYWQFEGEPGQTEIAGQSTNSLRKRDEDEEVRLLANASAVLSFRPPFMLHTEDSKYGDLRARRALEARNSKRVLTLLQKKDFLCPDGTSDCSYIDQPNYCCGTGEKCFAITDAGLGPVGCCPAGATCGNKVASCNAPNTACPDTMGGGCCIPNYVCAGIGCVINPSLVVTEIITLTISNSASSSTETSTIVITTSPTTSTSTSSSSASSTCTPGFQSCPASLGGGCCPTTRLCASGASCAPLSTTTTTAISVSTSTTGTSTITGVAPVRPTSLTSTSTQSSLTGATCPTGFYACEAYYAGGCCRTGRDCQPTSCPPTSSTTIISGSVTIVVPVGPAATVAIPTGTCASGWATCAPSVGGNCCPSGWECGTAKCSSEGATNTAVLQKASPGMGVSNKGVGGVVAALTGFVVGFMLL